MVISPAVVITGTCWPFQTYPPARCCQEIDENLPAGRTWHLVAASQNYRKVAAREMSPPAVPASQGPCKGVCSFYFRNEPHHLTPVSLGSQNLRVIFQATLAMSHFETDQAASCLAPDIFFLLSSTLDFCSFILLPPPAFSCSGSSSSL